MLDKSFYIKKGYTLHTSVMLFLKKCNLINLIKIKDYNNSYTLHTFLKYIMQEKKKKK